MQKSTTKSYSVIILSILILSIVQSIPAYASQYKDTPSLGAGRFPYRDGLNINGITFDVSQFSEKIQTQNLPIGNSSTIILKVFDNHGPTTITTASLFLNLHDNSISKSDTWIQYAINKGKVTVQDPHHMLGTVKATYTIKKPFGYVTFNITPNAKMDVSNLLISIWDDKKGSVNTTVINALSIS